jgi:hypothetical protein
LALREEAHRQVDDLLRAGVITAGEDCEWVAPIVMVRKKGGTWRMAVDYRYLNLHMRPDAYPIPVIADVYAQLSGATLFSTIDLNWGFWNVRLHPQSQPFTGFVVPGKGVFMWHVLPFGIKVAPSEFQRAIEKALRPVLNRAEAHVYIDDTVIPASSPDEALDRLDRVLGLFEDQGFFINMRKSRFLRSSVSYLGSQISANRIRPDPDKVRARARGVSPGLGKPFGCAQPCVPRSSQAVRGVL